MNNFKPIIAALIILFASSCATCRINAPEFIGKWDMNDKSYFNITKDSKFQFVAIEGGNSIIVATGVIEINNNIAQLTATETEIDKIQLNVPMLRLELIDNDKIKATDLQWGGDSIFVRHRE